MIKILKITGIILGGLLVLTALVGLVLYSVGLKKFNQTYSDNTFEMVNIPSDAEAIASGKHIATIWACTRCHGEDLSGKILTNDPIMGSLPLFGAIPAANLTSGEGGIAADYSDTDWIRAIRYGVMPEGRGEVLMFDYSTMNDQDLGNLIAYLKQIPPVDTNYPELRYGPFLPIVSAFGLFAPTAGKIDYNTPRPVYPTPDATVEYGRYLSGICAGCHGSSMSSEVKRWNQDDFIHSFNTGNLPDGRKFGSTMSSEMFRELTDTELVALWLYFTSNKS